MDPGVVLTQVEEMLISAVIPMMSVPYGQYGYSGHVINLPQNIFSIATTTSK